MNQSEVLSKLQDIFNDIFLVPVTLAPTLSALDVPEWDSLLHISLMLAVESAFKIRFRVGEIEATRNVGDLADLIIKRIDEA